MVQKQIHIFFTGRVQGVFFRQSTKVMAIKNNVKGWVRNLDDGRVEIVAQGETQDIENLTQWFKTGPANSRVDEFELSEENISDEFETFEVRY